MVSKELLEELKIILFEEFGLSLKNSEVYDIAISLMEYFETLAKIECGES